MATAMVIGAQWGDEGKGKIVDYLAAKADVVVRSQGGNNAGHTVVTGGKAYPLRLMPSGIMYPGTICIVGTGVVVDPKSLLEEMAHLEKQGISVEVVDLRTLVPMDKEAIINSVKKTGRLLIVDEGYTSFGIAAEICAAIQDEVFYYLDAPIRRHCAPDVPIPFSPALEKLVVPNENTILNAIMDLVK